MQRLVARLTNKMILIAMAVAILLSVSPSAAQAQEGNTGNGLRITTRNELIINPGETKEFTISVRNVTAAPVDAVVNFNDFVPDPNETGTVKLILDESVAATEYSLKSFVSGETSIPLEAGEEKEALFSVTMPESSTPGAYYGAVRFTAVPKGTEDVTGAVLSASLGSLLLVQVPGNIVDLLTLESISAVDGEKTGTVFQEPPTAVQVRLRNEGNAFSKPFGRVVVKNWGGTEIYSYELNSAEPRGNVLPESVRNFTDTLPEDLIGSFGRYTIEANISYSDGGNVITAKSTFWVLPWSVVLAVVGGLIVIALFLTRGLPAYNRMIRNQGKSEKVVK